MPFDPDWDFETLIEYLNERHRPGSIMAGKTRNALLEAWGLCVGARRATASFLSAKAKYTSQTAAARAFRMRNDYVGFLEGFYRSVPEVDRLPADAEQLRTALEPLSNEAKADFLLVATQLAGDPGVVRKLASHDTLANVAAALRPAIRVAEIQTAVRELETLLRDDVDREKPYQDWCEAHSWAFGNAYVVRDRARRIDRRNIADLLLPNLVGFRDIVELKRPGLAVLGWDRSHRCHYLSAECSKAIAQVHKYMDALHDAATAQFSKKPHLLAYHPHAVVVMGRSSGWNAAKQRDLRGLNERLHGVTVMTFDHLLGQAQQLLSTVAGR